VAGTGAGPGAAGAAAPVEVSLLVAGSCTHPERLTRRGAPWRPAEFPALVAVIRHPVHGVVLFDTGYGPRFFAETSRFPASLHARITPVRCPPGDTAAEQLERAGIATAQVRTVVLSHLHADHAAGARDFPAARFVYSHRAGAGLAGGRLATLRRGVLPGLLPEDLARRTTYVEDLPRAGAAGAPAPLDPGYDLTGDGTITAVPLPGHQAGHLGLYVRARGAEVLLVGDAAWSTRAITHLEPPHVAARLVTHDWAGYRATLRALHRLQEERPDLVVVPSHCPDAIERARRALGAAS
jgi:glyoxylase-like metal-dependent hydrolase (beta-lactamase superfamily II)